MTVTVETGIGMTFSPMEPVIDPVAAETVTAPRAMPVTTPLDETVATASEELDHVNDVTETLFPLASRACAESEADLPISSDAADDVMDTEETVGVGGGPAIPPFSPPPPPQLEENPASKTQALAKNAFVSFISIVGTVNHAVRATVCDGEGVRPQRETLESPAER